MSVVKENSEKTTLSRSVMNRLQAHERRLQEAVDMLDRVVDPREAFYGDDGETWLPTSDGRAAFGSAAGAYRSEEDLRRLREESRRLAIENEFAINAFENRVSYVVGWGHTYHVVARNEQDATLAAEVEGVLDEFRRVNNWRRRQQEILRRKDRDGECFLRFFPGDDGVLRLRFVEPEHVGTPPDLANDSQVRLGVRHAPGDVETRTHYYV
ncbi:MAG TPA: phage portal protein, partial [Pirellulales bacterium]